MAFTAQSVSRSHPITSSTPSIAVHGSFLPVNSDRVGSAGREITPSVLPSAFPRHRSSVAVSGAYVCAYGNKLSLTAALPLPPTPPASSTVSARSRSAVNPQPPLAIPSRRRRAASFLPPLARSPYCQPRSSHPQRKKPPPLQAPGTTTSISRLRRYAHPRPRCTVRRCTDSVPAVRQPLRSPRVTCGLGQGQVGTLS